MSSKKRRAKRKIAMMVRMDQTRMRMLPASQFLAMMGADPQTRFAELCMVPLGKKLTRLGLRTRAIAALKAAGTDIQGG